MRTDVEEFFLDVDPAMLRTAQQKGVNFAARRVFTKPEVERSRRLLMAALLRAVGQRRHFRCCGEWGAWGVSVCYRYGLPKRGREALRGRYKVTRPDCDNLTKMVLDVITESGLFWGDDAEVAFLAQAKVYAQLVSDRPGIRLGFGREAWGADDGC